MLAQDQRQARKSHGESQGQPINSFGDLGSARVLELSFGEVDNGTGLALRGFDRPDRTARLIGNAFDVTAGNATTVVATWSKRRPTVVLHSSDLNEKREFDVYELDQFPPEYLGDKRVSQRDRIIANNYRWSNEYQVRQVAKKNRPAQGWNPSFGSAGYHQHEANDPNNTRIEKSILGIEDVMNGHEAIFAPSSQVEQEK
jgi:hypothetical protein